MEQYPVPQFIEDEAKMVSFLTVRQFVYLVVAGGILFVLYSVLPFSLFILSAMVVGGVAGVAAFIKVDGTPILNILLSSIGFLSKAKSYTWKKKESLYPFKTVQRAPLKKVEEESKLGVGQRSNLRKLKTQVELKTK